jgi:hypothetical protein
MEDLKFIFYLVVALGWLVLRNYRKVQANRPGQAPVPETPAVDMDEVTEPDRPATVQDAWRQAKSARAAEPKRPVRKRQVPAPYAPDAPNEEARLVTAYFSQQREEEKSRERVAGTDAPETAAAAFLDPGNFDLRKAVIYAEVLKRPDF